MKKLTGAICLLLLALSALPGQSKPPLKRPQPESPSVREMCREEITCVCVYDPQTKLERCEIRVETICD